MMSACTPKKLTFLRSKVKEEKTEVKEKNDIIYLKKKKKGEKKKSHLYNGNGFISMLQQH